MRDLIGPNPCEGCDCSRMCLRDYGEKPATNLKLEACGPYAAYAAKRELLEKLKATGIHYGKGKLVQFVGVNAFQQHRGPGDLVFIPAEATQ